MTETIWPAKPKIFIIQNIYFQKEFARPWVDTGSRLDTCSVRELTWGQVPGWRGPAIPWDDKLVHCKFFF